MHKAMKRLIVGALVTTLSLLLPTLVRAYGTADEPKTVLTKTMIAVEVAANTKNKKPANTNTNAAKGSVELLEALKKARKEKGGGK